MQTTRQLLSIHKTTDRSSKNWKTVLILNERVNGEKKLKLISEPDLTFYATKPEIWNEKYSNGKKVINISKDELDEVTCKFDNIYNSIADLSEDYIEEDSKRNKAFIKDCYQTKRTSYLRNLHLNNWLFSSDVDITDHYYEKYVTTYKKELDNTLPSRGFFDIEVDGRLYRQFPDEEIAPCPINAISYFDDQSKILYGLFLDYGVEDNPLIEEFITIRKDSFEKELAIELTNEAIIEFYKTKTSTEFDKYKKGNKKLTIKDFSILYYESDIIAKDFFNKYNILDIIDNIKDIEKVDEIFLEYLKNNIDIFIKLQNVDVDKFKIFVKLEFFSSELELIKRFFYLSRDYHKSDYMLAFNAGFDILTIMNRLRNEYDIEPSDIFCDENIPIHLRQCWYRKSGYVGGKTRKDSWNITSSQHFSDMARNYIDRRQGANKLDDYKLNTILEHELGLNKIDYGDIQIKDLPYTNYELFVKYSLIDTFRLYQLDNSIQDVKVFYDLSLYTCTRFEKVMTKTVMLRNLLSVTYKEENIIICNNYNNKGEYDSEDDEYDTEEVYDEDGNLLEIVQGSKVGFRAGYVADPWLSKVGEEIVKNIKSKYIFKNVNDFDFAALYPTMITIFNLDMLTQIGRVVFKDDEMSEHKTNRATYLMDDLAVRNNIYIGDKYLNLPNYSELIDMFDKL